MVAYGRVHHLLPCGVQNLLFSSLERLGFLIMFSVFFKRFSLLVAISFGTVFLFWCYGWFPVLFFVAFALTFSLCSLPAPGDILSRV